MSPLQLYQTANSITEMEESRVPVAVQLYCTHAIQEHYAPWHERESSAPPAMAYKHWADLIRSTVYGPGATQETARHGDPLDYRTFLYLKFFAGIHMAAWVEQAKAIDPMKGYKLARKIAAPILKEEAAKFRLAVQFFEGGMLSCMEPTLMIIAA